VSVIILQRLGITDWKVQCTVCLAVYNTTSFRSDLDKRRGCSDCFPGNRGKIGRPRDPVSGRILPGKAGT
jgi:hypothetical protein